MTSRKLVQKAVLILKKIHEVELAMIYVCAFFIVILIVFIIGAYKCFKVDEFKDMLVTVSGVLSGPLGFIVGYYFKASKE